MESTNKMIDIIKKEKQTNLGKSRTPKVYIKFNLKYNKDLEYI